LRAVLLLASTDITAFHIIGGLLALWAVVLAALGVMRHDFPGGCHGQAAVMGITGLLVAGAIGSAIATAKDEPKGKEKAGATPSPVSPGTGSGAGQTPGGQGKPAPAGGTVQTLLLSADPSGQLRFDKSSLQASAGTVRITMKNPSPIPHNISLQGPGGLDKHGPTVGQGGASQVAAPVKAGTYTYYCSVPGHRQAGMQGTLTVK
jgi:plastocyanin